MPRCGVRAVLIAAAALAVGAFAQAAAFQEPDESRAPAEAPIAQVDVPGNGVTWPAPIKLAAPQYPDAAVASKIEGLVRLRAVVNTDGAVGQVSVLKSLDSDHGLDQAAIAAARLWLFQPAMRDGKPVAVYIDIEMSLHPPISAVPIAAVESFAVSSSAKTVSTTQVSISQISPVRVSPLSVSPTSSSAVPVLAMPILTASMQFSAVPAVSAPSSFPWHSPVMFVMTHDLRLDPREPQRGVRVQPAPAAGRRGAPLNTNERLAGFGDTSKGSDAGRK